MEKSQNQHLLLQTQPVQIPNIAVIIQVNILIAALYSPPVLIYLICSLFLMCPGSFLYYFDVSCRE